MRPFRPFLMFVFMIFSLVCFGQSGLEMKIGSYNIRYDNRGDREKGDAWENRLPHITDQIIWEDPDIFGAQEVLAHQLSDMLARLPDYNAHGAGRDDGKEKGEYAPVFYKKDKFKLLEAGNFWLSETPGQPSKGWDAALPRICSWVQLEENATGRRFWFFNLHLDHVGIVAREKSCELVVEKMKEMAGEETGFLTGDFNVDQHNQIYNILQNSGYIHDSYELAPHRMSWNGTFNAFRADRLTDSRIDHIFVTGDVEVTHYAVLTDTYRSASEEAEGKNEGDSPQEMQLKKFDIRLPSDHFPIFAKVRY